MAISDNTITTLQELAKRYPRSRSAVMPMLHLVQSEEGSITPEGIGVCADILGLTAAEVTAVASFYTMYKRRTVGRHHIDHVHGAGRRDVVHELPVHGHHWCMRAGRLALDALKPKLAVGGRLIVSHPKTF